MEKISISEYLGYIRSGALGENKFLPYRVGISISSKDKNPQKELEWLENILLQLDTESKLIWYIEDIKGDDNRIFEFILDIINLIFNDIKSMKDTEREQLRKLAEFKLDIKKLNNETVESIKSYLN